MGTSKSPGLAEIILQEKVLKGRIRRQNKQWSDNIHDLPFTISQKMAEKMKETIVRSICQMPLQETRAKGMMMKR